ncbi:hypothetical protein HPB50_009631 [Hyalomma asiaticum]|uniref:Uncharacterized protein n=1 Tax=Hyalomma asiaticum TaxID=266040 RepID=A0ACB7TK03_HYAAI|nr:hypothetical protein HPB50_009631 [Hyalomma asiaticum]
MRKRNDPARHFSVLLAITNTANEMPLPTEGDEEDVREGCPQNREEAAALGRRCLRKCKTDEDCISSKKKCLCDGRCGWSCVRPVSGTVLGDVIIHRIQRRLVMRALHRARLTSTSAADVPSTPPTRLSGGSQIRGSNVACVGGDAQASAESSNGVSAFGARH